MALERLKRRVTAKHFQLFYLSVILGKPAAEVAATIRTNRGEVYLVKHRVGLGFRRILKTLGNKPL